MDRMRESMFSILGDISGLAFLDLFTGSGVVGIEAASRGAEPVMLVEMDRRKAPVIRRNIEFVESSISLRLMPAERFLKKPDRTYAIVYLDPPFNYTAKQELIELVSHANVLVSGGLCLIHHPSNEKWPEAIENLQCSDIRVYGGSTLRFFTFTLS
jgi:16S rRNA (guanine(966)-N(2))-methyltransferase RsmD